MRSTLPAALLAAASLALPAVAGAVDVNDGQLTLHGDGEWAYQRTFNDNRYLAATPLGNYDTAMFDLVLAARPTADLVISAQLGYDADQVQAEWVFAEWRFSEQLRVRVGKVQQPFGNMNELRFAGTTRAFFNLPTSVYGPSNVSGTAYQGAGLTGQTITDGGWTLAWDAYGGALELTELDVYAALDLVTGAAAEPVVGLATQEARDLLGGRFSVTTPADFTLRLSGYGGRLAKADGTTETLLVGGASLQRRGERLWLDAEVFYSDEMSHEHAWAAYATAAWFLTEHLQAALHLEAQRTTLDAYAGASSLLRHDEWAVGLNWWVNPSLVFRASWHHVEGNRFTYPEETAGQPTRPRDLLLVPPDQSTSALVVGTQFAF